MPALGFAQLRLIGQTNRRRSRVCISVGLSATDGFRKMTLGRIKIMERRMTPVKGVLIITGLLLALSRPALAADRVAELERLTTEYAAAEQKFFDLPTEPELTDAESIQRYEAFPAWEFLPRFLALAEARPDDETAFRACQWIIDRERNVGNDDRRIYRIDQRAWEIIAAHHAGRDDLPTLCLRASEYPAPAQEKFLRALLKQEGLKHDGRGFATIALAELLAKSHGRIEFYANRPAGKTEFVKFLERQRDPDWEKALAPANAPQLKAEAAGLYRKVLAEYADVPVTISEPGFRRLKNLGEKASKSLHALEHLTIGSPAPTIVGTDLRGEILDLADYKGKVIVLSFWFTGCGPCMALVPQEQRLIETYKDRPFALVSVCTDATRDQAQKTAQEHGIAWPCWFDGENGPIARDWNVLSWPTIYVLDRSGKIVARQLRGEDLDAKLKELLD
jgi:thiol-disulfide isomerase/thioredoxin